MQNNPVLTKAYQWFSDIGWQPQTFQEQAWNAFVLEKQGIVNAPTGSGKTYSLLLPAILDAYQREPRAGLGVRVIWITPIRALAKEILISTERALTGMNIPWKVGIRTGDTSAAERARQKEKAPEILITTPESLHLLLASKGYPQFFSRLSGCIADEWHELVGSKRGVQVELALSRLRTICSHLKVWGISATIGNLDEALTVLLGVKHAEQGVLIKADIHKQIEVVTILPDTIEKFPWGGHLGIHLLEKVISVIEKSKTTLIFTNTRAQAEIWYQRLLEVSPDLAGCMAMHHGSISQELRHWVEEQLYEGKIKVVVCTSSLDLGVDFRPVETIIQIGGPKGVSRFLQRAGRSGHAPGQVSRIYFVPTHSLEIMEGAALRDAIEAGQMEARIPYIRSFDVLVQYLVTLAVSEGFLPAEIYNEVIQTHCYASLSPQEFDEILSFIATGGNSLQGYDEYHKVVIHEGKFMVTDRRIALRHRLSIGTIVSDAMMHVKFLGGKSVGTIEEWFVAKLKPGDVFWFGGRNLELIKIKEMTVFVRLSQAKSGLIPSWQGGRMPLSSQMSDMLREKLHQAHDQVFMDAEMQSLIPLFQTQHERSVLPSKDEFLIEKIKTKEGTHLFVYPFEGRFVHEGLSALIAYRISQFKPITFSIAMNDYGFELLSDQDIPIEEALDSDIFSPDYLMDDIRASVNATELARRRFRDIARISGLVFSGFPGKHKKDRHLQASGQLFFDVFADQEPSNLLYVQAFEEVYDFQLEQVRLREALLRITHQKIRLVYPEKPTPFSFPIMIERIREKFSNEPIEDRIEKMMKNIRD